MYYKEIYKYIIIDLLYNIIVQKKFYLCWTKIIYIFIENIYIILWMKFNHDKKISIRMLIKFYPVYIYKLFVSLYNLL